MEELLRNMDWELFEKQKEWLVEQVAALEPSGSEASEIPEGILNMMDRMQEVYERWKEHRYPYLFSITTPKGLITAREYSDGEYHGINLVYSEPGLGEPGALMEYSPVEDAVMLRVWDKNHVDTDPNLVRKMSE